MERKQFRLLVFLPALVFVLFTGCGGSSCCTESKTPPAEPKATPPAAPMSPQPAAAPNAQIANPASVNCLDQGGKLEMQRGDGGEFGVCVFADGSRCEEWRLFRKTCTKGQCRETSGICGP